MPFVEWVEDSGEFRVNEDAVAYLSSLSGHVAVVAVAGKYRTGKSYLLNLLADLRAKLGMTYLFVSHDLQVVRMLCDQVLVMQSGKIVEKGDCEAVMSAPSHPMTQALLAATPRLPATAFQ